ncbi:concanavalin A-like lectin/glucanase [Sarocladium strictum]
MKLLGVVACFVASTSALTTVCGSNEIVRTTNFDVRNYFVPEIKGSSCTTLLWSHESAVSWSAKWSWTVRSPAPASSDDISSSSMAHLTIPGSTRISSLESIPTSWLWRYACSCFRRRWQMSAWLNAYDSYSYQYPKSIQANVYYDIFGFSDGSTGGNFNLQIWLGTYGGLKPLGSKFATARLSNVNFDIFTDESSPTRTHTFVAKSTQTSFKGDLLDFLDWTVDHLGVGTSWYIYTIRAGTNAYQGVNATFSSTSLSLAPKYKPVPTSSEPPAPSQTAPGCAPQWGQCGGQGWSGPTCCQSGIPCVYLNQYHSQCLAD